MSNPYFKFKEFTVFHDRCAMKVGTDGVLLGAWALLSNARSVLDIGTGTGLIALMAAQRNPMAEVVGVELDEEASVQAAENVAASPWNDRIRIVQSDIKAFECDRKFDAILSNPPYFSNAVGCPEQSRLRARHDTDLSFGELLAQVVRLLDRMGEFSIVIPLDAAPTVIGLAAQNRLFLWRKTLIQTTPKASPKRCLLSFRFEVPNGVEENTLLIQEAPMVYTEEYRRLTHDFYLNM